jgi:hypothetical protein
MAIKITLFITLVCYAFVVCQSFFYILALSGATKKMDASAYIETRKLIDKELSTSLYIVYYLALAASIALTAFSVVNPQGILFISSVVALVALVADILLSVKGNIPINRTINSWTTNEYPANWQQYRSRWFSLYQIRQFVNIIGFIALLAAIVFGI